MFYLFLSSEPQHEVNPLPKKPQVKIEVPTFNPDSAYHFIQKQVDFGPRVISSKSWELCESCLVEHKISLKYAPEVIVQSYNNL